MRRRGEHALLNAAWKQEVTPGGRAEAEREHDSRAMAMASETLGRGGLGSGLVGKGAWLWVRLVGGGVGVAKCARQAAAQLGYTTPIWDTQTE